MLFSGSSGGGTIWGWWTGFSGCPSPRQQQCPVLSVSWAVGRLVSRGPGEKLELRSCCKSRTRHPLPPQQAFNAAAVVHHMRKLHMNLHSPSVRPEVENRPPVSPAPEVSRPSSHDSTITEAPILDPSTPLPALTRLPCPHSSRPSAPGGRSLNCLVNGSLRISSSLVPMQQGPLATGPCGCCSSCLNIGNKGKSSYCSEPTLFRKANKKQYVVSQPVSLTLLVPFRRGRNNLLKNMNTKVRPANSSHRVEGTQGPGKRSFCHQPETPVRSHLWLEVCSSIKCITEVLLHSSSETGWASAL